MAADPGRLWRLSAVPGSSTTGHTALAFFAPRAAAGAAATAAAAATPVSLAEPSTSTGLAPALVAAWSWAWPPHEKMIWLWAAS